MNDEIEARESLRRRRDIFWSTQLKITEQLQTRLFENLDNNLDEVIQLLQAVKLSTQIIRDICDRDIYPPL